MRHNITMCSCKDDDAAKHGSLSRITLGSPHLYIMQRKPRVNYGLPSIENGARQRCHGVDPVNYIHPILMNMLRIHLALLNITFPSA